MLEQRRIEISEHDYAVVVVISLKAKTLLLRSIIRVFVFCCRDGDSLRELNETRANINNPVRKLGTSYRNSLPPQWTKRLREKSVRYEISFLKSYKFQKPR